MADTKPREEWTADDYRVSTEDARRQARYRAAQQRIQRIVDGSPKLRDDELSALAVLLHPGTRP